MAYPTDITPREATPSASSRLFSFQRVRSGTSTRFYPGAGTKLHFANRDVDTLEMPDVPNGFLAAGDVVTATYKGTCVFRGDVATIAEARGRGTDATQTVTCVGPWSKMARLVYRQNWFTGGGYSRSSRLVLNQHQDGSTQNLNSELYEIASHGATPCGYTVTQADVAVSTQQLPFDECRDITVADAIRRELRFFPKAVCRFDYSGETPALKIKKTASPTTAAYVAAIPKNRREYVYNAHPITGVDLEIETTGTVDGVEYRQIDHQTAGNTSAGNPDCLYATLQIKGASSNTTRQSFKSVTEDIPQNLNDAAWWKARHPRLANVAANAIAISEGSRTPSNYPRISAATAGELEEAGLHCEVSKFTCKATITTADDKEEEIFLTMNFLTTNATGTAADPKTYTWVAESSSESGETVPSGLAATILAERAGSLLSERMTVRLGDALPQLGDAIVETEGTVFLQSIDVDCASLTADLKFGVPDYLSPEDMAALLSGFRNKRTSSSHTVRKTGKPDDNGSNVEMGAIPPLSSTEFAPGQKAKTIVGSKAANSPSIKLDATGSGGNMYLKTSEVPSGKTVGIKSFKVDNTEVAKVAATEDINITATEPDNVSIEKISEPEAGSDPSGAEGKLQIAHFNDTEKDSGKGLANRLRANTETGEITSDTSNLMLVARRNGEVVYIPLSGNGTDPDDESPGSGGKDPCEHPGGGGGASPDDDGGGHGGGGMGGGDGGGGVLADGDTHIGDNGCNCE